MLANRVPNCANGAVIHAINHVLAPSPAGTRFARKAERSSVGVAVAVDLGAGESETVVVGAAKAGD